MNIKISRAVMVMEVEKGCGMTSHKIKETYEDKNTSHISGIVPGKIKQ